MDMLIVWSAFVGGVFGGTLGAMMFWGLLTTFGGLKKLDED